MHAKVEPMIHAHRRTATGFVPAVSSSSGLSTTPRIARPSLANRKKRESAAVETSAIRAMMTRSQLTAASARVNAFDVGR